MGSKEGTVSPEEVTCKPIESNAESRRRVATDSETSRKHVVLSA